MKKALFIALCVAALALTGCGQGGTPDATAASQTTTAPTQTVQTESAAASEIDLTGMSSTMVYSYVYNMISAPDDFIGQRFRIRGIYDEGLWEVNNQMYHYIVIADAASCCAQGLEFTLADENTVYPQPGDEIEISGIFGTYEEEGSLYIQIVADSIKTA